MRYTTYMLRKYLRYLTKLSGESDAAIFAQKAHIKDIQAWLNSLALADLSASAWRYYCECQDALATLHARCKND